MLRKQVGQMAKLLGTWKKSKIRVDEHGIETKSCVRPRIFEGQPSFLTKNDGVDTNYTTRRQIVLNRHFTEIISDVLALDLKKELVQMGVTITSIETKAWNTGLNIFYTTDKPFDLDLNDLLNSLTKLLCKAIAERQLIGRIPAINFVYDRISQLDKTLNEALKAIPPRIPDQSTTPSISSSSNLSEAKQTKLRELDFVSRNFSSPIGMSNVMAGLRYPDLYNEVIDKQVQGRAQSSRMISCDSVIVQKPSLRMCPETNDAVEDPIKRVIQMQSFLISQRKKSEYVAKVKRKQQLLLRDAYKWDLPESEDSSTKS